MRKYVWPIGDTPPSLCYVNVYAHPVFSQQPHGYGKAHPNRYRAVHSAARTKPLYRIKVKRYTLAQLKKWNRDHEKT